jgi:hypothetical protein
LAIGLSAPRRPAIITQQVVTKKIARTLSAGLAVR